ncbi:hypothetical protein PM082_004127 [Marasmius tenuissimus]|nr:hypothetical protein PM082_004127 [Marasmius tenuissimus]
MFDTVNRCNDTTHFVVGYQGIWQTFPTPLYYRVEEKVFNQWGVDNDYILSIYCTEQDVLVVRQQRVDPNRRQSVYWQKLWRTTPQLGHALPPAAWHHLLSYTRPFEHLPNYVRQWWAIIEIHKPLRTIFPHDYVRRHIIFQQARFIKWFGNTLKDEFTFNGRLTIMP